MPHIPYTFSKTDQILDPNPLTWNPQGVCLVVGPDELEKVTLFDCMPGMSVWDEDYVTKDLFHHLERWHANFSKEKWDAFIEEVQTAFPLANLPFTPRLLPKNHRPALYQLGLLFFEDLEKFSSPGGSKGHAFIGIENFGDRLTPHTIRALIRTLRNQADERDDLTIVLTTHSPIVMDEFKGCEDQFFVMQEGRPVALDEAYNPDWLAHFSLGDLYAREQIG